MFDLYFLLLALRLLVFLVHLRPFCGQIFFLPFFRLNLIWLKFWLREAGKNILFFSAFFALSFLSRGVGFPFCGVS